MWALFIDSFSLLTWSQIFAGIDVSTQSQKLVVVDFENDSIIYSDSINYDNDLLHYGTLNGVIEVIHLVCLNQIQICGLTAYIFYSKG